MQRVNETLTGPAERRVLAWLCRNLPRWATSDMLTSLGVLGAAVACLGYAMSGEGYGYLWLAIAGIVVNWFGDSLDGSLARHRAAERPKYGFFLDHMTDTLAIGLIALGIGLSPHALLASGLAVLLGYYAMVILSMVTCVVTGVFQISFGRVGPTEIRLVIIACTLFGIFLPIPVFRWQGLELTVYDLIIVAVTALLVLTCLLQSAKTLGELAEIDPPKR